MSEARKLSLKVLGVPVEIRRENLPNINHKNFRLSWLPGWYIPYKLNKITSYCIIVANIRAESDIYSIIYDNLKVWNSRVKHLLLSASSFWLPLSFSKNSTNFILKIVSETSRPQSSSRFIRAYFNCIQLKEVIVRLWPCRRFKNAM
jgi:hypothetical protein